MEKLKITKGEWRIENKSANGIVKREDAIAITVDNDFNWDVCCMWNDIEEGMAEANANLTIDAANTYQQCETLPSELLRQNREMKEALEKAEEALEWYMTECTPDNDNYQSFHDIGMNARSVLRDCLTSCNKGKDATS